MSLTLVTGPDRRCCDALPPARGRPPDPAQSGAAGWGRASGLVFVGSVGRPVRQPPTVRIFSRLALVVIASGVMLALAVGALAVPARLLDKAGSGDPGPISLRPLAQRSYMYAAHGSVLAALRCGQHRH